ncbi:putative fungal zn binuclear cluster domain containing protein [Phaeoacremonium minimum UCRPA7]|uniref:Putative fungal zn binuclear cluster domain containing protein n=1 Tax=Phaeoacremonium minimum (strain UCR-PA7) TaxID=1286976 RepID=R8BRD6_PHAM7|nr:putative fungal zn binuclear cluster domain containing protein [Phaeoacremonium minimum UCRPA7]EOO01889.1 putative fungal zn binuclear cluster domain containing protein [Phaeoacremonium minimum UCRPA7]
MTFKEKKKKCDEERPQCSRCAERGLDCNYEPVKPRQRRKRDSAASTTTASKLALNSSHDLVAPGSGDSPDSDDSGYDFHHHNPHGHSQVFGDEVYESDLLSPLQSPFDTVSLLSYPLAELSTLSPIGSVACDLPADFDEDETAEEVTSHAVVHHGSKLPDLAMIAPCPTGSPLLEFCVPAFSEFSDRPNRRALVDHFCNVLSHLIVFREESGNPFQQLVLPLSQKSSPVMNAIYALASAHLEYRGVENGEKSLYFHNQAIQGLARLIEREGKVNRNELLAAIMLIVYYEVLVQKGRSNIVEGHLKGALAIMSSSPEPTDPTAIFLERAFRFYDVIAALSFGTAPLSTAPAAGCLLPFPPLGAPAVSALSNVDTLLGMATTLWPIIHRLSGLSSLKSELENAVGTGQMSSKIAVLRTELETTSDAIEVALRQWQPCLPSEFSPDDAVECIAKAHAKQAEAAKDSESPEKARLHSIFNNAMAYRHSAFVYLYRTIYGYSRSSPLVQSHAHAALVHCAATCSYEGPMSALLWPLFVAACEAATAEDRELARDAFVRIEKRQGMMNIERAWDIVREVWRRTDMSEKDSLLADVTCRERDGKSADLWRRVSEDMGVNIVFG